MRLITWLLRFFIFFALFALGPPTPLPLVALAALGVATLLAAGTEPPAASVERARDVRKANPLAAPRIPSGHAVFSC
jgi:hypothetical protein